MKAETVKKIQFSSRNRMNVKKRNVCQKSYTFLMHAKAESDLDFDAIHVFSELWDRVIPWVQTNWDGTYLVYEHDVELIALEPFAPKIKPWFICPFRPTPENMANYLLKKIIPGLLPGNINIDVSVRIAS